MSRNSVVQGKTGNSFSKILVGQDKRRSSGPAFYMLKLIPNMDTCIFCQIVSREAPSYTIWEDEKHIAFLSIFPNTEGTTVVITKAHYPSYAFDLPDEVLAELVLAAKEVA